MNAKQYGRSMFKYWITSSFAKLGEYAGFILGVSGSGAFGEDVSLERIIAGCLSVFVFNTIQYGVRGRVQEVQRLRLEEKMKNRPIFN